MMTSLCKSARGGVLRHFVRCTSTQCNAELPHGCYRDVNRLFLIRFLFFSKGKSMGFGRRKVVNAQDELEQSVSRLRELLANADLDNIPEVLQLRKRLDEGLSEVQDSAIDVVHEAKRHARHAARATNEYVHDEPWQIVGGALAAGVVLGFLLGRR